MHFEGNAAQKRMARSCSSTFHRFSFRKKRDIFDETSAKRPPLLLSGFPLLLLLSWLTTGLKPLPFWELTNGSLYRISGMYTAKETSHQHLEA